MRRPTRWLLASIVLLTLGGLAIVWAVALAVFLVSTCDNKFGISSPPSLRCFQPVLWEILGAVLAVLGVASGVVGLLSRRASARR
jgi:hypothetical protein